MIFEYYAHRYEDDGCLWALPLSKLPDHAMRQHLKLISAAIGAGTWCLRQELDYCDGNVIWALQRYNRGNNPGVSWQYIHDVMNEMIHFNNGDSK